MEEFELIVSRLPRSVVTLFLWGQGEPFLAPEFLGMVDFAARRGYRTVTSTNGHFLDDPEGIVRSGLARLVVSLDGADPETYASYRIGGDFHRVVEGVRQVAEASRRLGCGPDIHIQCVVNRMNERSRDKIRTLASETGARRVVFKTLQAASIPGGGELLPQDPRFSRYRKGMDGCLETDRRGMLANRCMRIYYSFQVDWQGNVVPCCFDKNSEHLMGNLISDTFDTVWNSPRYREFRRTLNHSGRVLAMCRDCTEGLRRMNIYA
jgi:radical SAM protein with 4Fe4S-binding SPASM domain